MKKLMHTLCLSTIVVFGVAHAERQSQYGGFSADNLKEFHTYLNGLKAIKVEATDNLRQAVEAVPMNLSTAIDLQQEAGLRDWLYDFLVAFSDSGSDSLAAAFYLREGTDDFRIEKVGYKMTKLPNLENLKQGGASGDGVGISPAPFSFFKTMHRLMLDGLERDYYFANVSLDDSEFRVFELQEEYESYISEAHIRGMVPSGTIEFTFKRRREVEKAVQVDEKVVLADVMFIIEDSEETAGSEGPIRTPFFFRLMWDDQQATWCHVEAFSSKEMTYIFLLGLI